MAGVEKTVIKDLRAALDGLASDDGGAGGWVALPALARLADHGMDFDIDMTATDVLGAPLVVATRRRTTHPALAALTPRQTQVARCVADGASNAQIAEALGITVGTVKDHVHAILERLGLERRQQIIALSHGASLASGAPTRNPSEDG